MRGLVLTTAALSLALAGCGRKAVTLPEDPIDRAATCGVVAAAAARKVAGAKGDLPLEAQNRILHYPLLAGSEGAVFDAAKAQAVVKRMPELQEKLVEGKWETLTAPCAEAYPETADKPISLPREPQQAQLACYMLTDFLKTAITSQEGKVGDSLAEYGALAQKLDDKVGPRLAAAGVKGAALQQRRAEALSTAAKLGPPTAVMLACLKKYG